MTDSPTFVRRIGWDPPRFSLPSGFVAPLGALLDVAVLMIASGLAEISYNGWRGLSAYDLDAAIVASLVFLLIGKFRGLYTFMTLAFPERDLTALLMASLLASAAVVGVLFLLHDLTKHSRGVELLYALYAMTLAPLARLTFARLVRAAHAADRLTGRRVVLVGEESELNRLTADDWLRFGVSEVARVTVAEGAQAISEEDRRRIALAIRLARTGRAVEIAILMPWSQDLRIEETLEALRTSPLGVRLYPDAATRNLLGRTLEGYVDQHLSLELRRPPLGTFDRVAKRAFDIVIATTALAALAPAMLIVAVVVRATSPGPAIFTQARRGFDGGEFRIWKFRSMTVVEDGPNIRQATRNDPRVTAVGRWLRRTSLDELPQLVNVVKGEMSLIGPRPHALAHDDAYGAAIREYALRRHVKPGMTGAAQAAGLRGETRSLVEMQARVARDIWYIDNWSMHLDIRIAFQTLFQLFRNEAY
jgi:undecaprenyl-phosphate galactose phosphotransferase/putative colanic acid biosynthesis UDP-glucose lipid carrier transferase